MGALLRVPYRMMFPAILIFCAIGVYSINNAPADVIMVATFGLVGYWLIKHDFEPAPMLLGFVLGSADGGKPAPRHADRARRSDHLPDTADLGELLVLAVLLLVLAVLPMIRKKRDEVFVEARRRDNLRIKRRAARCGELRAAQTSNLLGRDGDNG